MLGNERDPLDALDDALAESPELDGRYPDLIRKLAHCFSTGGANPAVELWAVCYAYEPISGSIPRRLFVSKVHVEQGQRIGGDVFTTFDIASKDGWFGTNKESDCVAPDYSGVVREVTIRKNQTIPWAEPFVYALIEAREDPFDHFNMDGCTAGDLQAWLLSLQLQRRALLAVQASVDVTSRLLENRARIETIRAGLSASEVSAARLADRIEAMKSQRRRERELADRSSALGDVGKVAAAVGAGVALGSLLSGGRSARVYNCRYCGATVTMKSTPSSNGCRANPNYPHGTNHWWTELGASG